MPVDYTVTGLLAQVRRRAMLPTDGTTLTDADIVEILNDELDTYIVPLLIESAQEYLVTTTTQAVTSGTAAYAIPSRAVGGKLRDLQVLDGTTYRSMAQIEPEDAGKYDSTGNPQAFYVQGNNVVLVPSPTAAGTIKFVYYRRPNHLTATAYSSATGTASTDRITVASIANLDYNANQKGYFDLVRSQPPFNTTYADVYVSDIQSTYVKVAAGLSALPNLRTSTAITDGASPGFDYVCVYGLAPVPQIPAELIPLLVQRTVARVLEALGDPKAQAARALCDDVRQKCLTLISPRTEGLGRVFTSYRGPGWGNGRSRFRA